MDQVAGRTFTVEELDAIFNRRTAGQAQFAAVALPVLVVLLAADGLAAVLGASPVTVVVAVAVHVAFFAAWLLSVRRQWVRDQAEVYAKTLFWALETRSLHPTGSDTEP